MKKTKTNICAVVIFYNPVIETITNIRTYINQVDRLYLIDNSNTTSLSLLKDLDYEDKIVYLPNYDNLGMGKALNIGIQHAINDNYSFVLTMDQDTQLPFDYINRIFSAIDNFDGKGIVTGFHDTANKKRIENKKKNVLTTLMSGNVLNLNSYKALGGFEEKLFIDYVDNEFCLRLNSNKYKVIVIQNILISHNLGTIKEKKLFFKSIYTTNHSPLRLYYRTRNRIFCIKKYGYIFPGFVFVQLFSFIKEVLIIIIFEKEVLNKLSKMILGFFHSLQNKYGRYE
ncbi:MAG: glycosyltransferase [Ignavibacteria bacterium]|nr:glycosyltransferase [Ignavibacteria bacterium]MDP3829847.1 glycosyltransferase [Ignavibacteriaceae bacterium]